MRMDSFTCVVAACNAYSDVAESVCAALRSMNDQRLLTRIVSLPVDNEDCDVLIPIVDKSYCSCIVDDIRRTHKTHPACSVIPVVLSLSQEQISSLLQAGSCDFTASPLDSEALIVRVRRALGLMPLRTDNEVRDVRDMMSPKLKELVGSSPAFMRPLSMLPMIAGYDAGVLILGETGTGKEVYARAIHYTSARAAQPWVAVNCGAVPTELLESELFGHVRGAFTHAHAARAGLVREAEGGTLFLDEIDSMPLAAQSKLLRFLQEMEYRPVGGDKMYRADVRIIAASNQDLPALAERGAFRRDLFFRLGVLTVTLPPLRERREDIHELARYFIEHFGRRSGRPRLGLSPQALKQLLAYDWPGNVRELRHAIERAVLMGTNSVLQPEDLQLTAHSAMPASADESLCVAKARMIAAFETDYIQRLLATCNGNITRAAQAAGKNRRAFFELMRKYGIDPVRFRSPHSSHISSAH
jgi:two-component system, NtrC family, response regulator GlrR